MKPLAAWLLLLSPALAPAARAEELVCEFDRGAASEARLDAGERAWRWAAAPSPLAARPGLRPGAAFWFMSARIPEGEGEGEGAVAGAELPPAADYWAAAVHRRPSLVLLVELGSDAVRVLAVSTRADAGGRRAATYSRQVGGPGALLGDQLTGSCRAAPGAAR